MSNWYQPPPGYGYHSGYPVNSNGASPSWTPQPQQPQYGYTPGVFQPYTHQQNTYGVPNLQPGTPIASQPTYWSPLLHPNGQPTPLFQSLSAAIFPHLSQGTGHITPEALSGFLELNGFLPEHDLWKRSLKPHVMFAAQDLADWELKSACEAWSFEHSVAARNPGRPQMPYGGMPLLTLRGFTDMMAVEHAAMPDRAYHGINATLRQYNIWPHLGPLPRNMLLASKPAEVQRLIDEYIVRKQRSDAEKLRANAVGAQLAAQGRQNALDSIDGPYVRRYYI